MMFKGRAFVIQQLEGLTRRKVSMSYFKLTPPLNVEIKNLNIEGLAKIEDIFISPSIPYLLVGNIAFNKISIFKPEFTFERLPRQPTELTAAKPPDKTAVLIQAPQEPIKKHHLRLAIKHLSIKDGKIYFIDQTVGTDGIKITIKDLNLNVTNLYTFPFSSIANFDLKGKIPWQEGQEEGNVHAEGWFNFFKRDIQATVKVEGIDGIYLYPYYSQWVDLEKARIEKARLNFTSNIQGLNNNVTAECRLELADIVRKPRVSNEPQEKAEKIAEVVFDIFRALNQGKIVLDFTIRTKLDRPEFGFGDIKMAVEDKIAKARSGTGIKPEGILILPLKLLEGTVKGATDISKAVIDGTFAVGNEFKKAVEDSFKKEPKEKK